MERPKSGRCNEQATKLWLQSTMRTSELTVYTPPRAPSLLHLISTINELASTNYTNGCSQTPVDGKRDHYETLIRTICCLESRKKFSHVHRLVAVGQA